MTDLRRRYLDHFTTAFGRPSGRRGFDSGAGQPPIEVLAFQGVVQDCQVFASLGFSSYLQQVRETAEVVVVVDSAGDRVPTILANVLFTLVHHPPGFGLGVAIRFPKVDPAFVAEFGKSALYFTYPILFPAFNITTGAHLCPPANTDVMTYKVQVIGNEVMVETGASV